MGAACCVAARDKTIGNGSTNETLQRSIHYSPSWSFRWDNRGRVAGEEISISQFSDGVSNSNRSETKFGSTHLSEEGSPLDHYRRRTWQKFPASEGTAGYGITPASDQSISRNVSMDGSLEQVDEPSVPHTVSCPSTAKHSLSFPSTSSLSTSPLSSQGNLPPSCSTPSRWTGLSPGHQLLRQVSDSRIVGFKSPNSFLVPDDITRQSSRNESVRGSHGGSSDGWSLNAFSELTATSHRERWSFDSESFGFNREKISRTNRQFSSSPTVDFQTCGACSKLLREKSSWGGQKIISELSVVAVLTCGHVYHAECLENMTPDINKYDPACPVCSFGEKQTLKWSERALKAEMELKSKNKRSRNRVVDSNVDGDSIAFEHFQCSTNEGKLPKMSSSSSMKSSSGKPFLRRHFSFSSKGAKDLLGNHSVRKKGFFWAKSSRT